MKAQSYVLSEETNMDGSDHRSISVESMDDFLENGSTTDTRNFPSHHTSMQHSSTELHPVASYAWLIILGDSLHNLIDGLVIGAAFSASTSSGIGTSIAVFCHELPHEFGDFAALLNAGWSWKRALAFNFFSSLTAFVGVIVGLGLGDIGEQTQMYIIALTAGMFIYVALADLVSCVIDVGTVVAVYPPPPQAPRVAFFLF